MMYKNAVRGKLVEFWLDGLFDTLDELQHHFVMKMNGHYPDLCIRSDNHV